MKDFFHVRHINNKVDVCFVHIPSFASAIIPGLDLTMFRRQRHMEIKSHDFFTCFFTDDDLKKTNSFKALKKQVEWMAGRAAIKILAEKRRLGPAKEIRIATEPEGAPYLADFTDLPVTISHSGDFAAGAIGTKGDCVAIDIELIETGRMQSVAKIAFSEREIDKLKNKSDEEYYISWTMKEAFLKYIRKGFAESLKKVEILDGVLFHEGRAVKDICIHTEIYEKKYALALMYSS